MAEKRSAEAGDLPSDAVKRQKPMDELSESGPLTQADVVYFKKEAIWRQMRTYKGKCDRLMLDLENLQRRYLDSEAKVNILDAWYEQIINQLDTSLAQSDELRETLLIKSTKQKPDVLEGALTKRREQLLRLLGNALAGSNQLCDRDLAAKLELVSNDLATVRADYEGLLSTNGELNVKVEELQESLLTLHKQKERENSKTLHRINGQAAVKEEEGPNPEPSAKTEESQVNTEELEKVTSELAQIKLHNNSLQEQLQDTTSKYSILSEENTQLQLRLNNLPERDLANSSLYQQLALTNKQLQEKIQNLQKVNDKTVSRVTELESLNEDAKAFANKELVDENEALKLQLAKCESDLVRIRTSRDELLSKNSILKAEADDKETNEALRQMNTILQQRVDKFEQAHAEKDSADADNLAVGSKEDLIKRIGILTAELKDIEEAFQQTRQVSLKKLGTTVDQEGMLKKLSVEKTKADQKYFAAMRVKDSLTAENKILKAQISKSQEALAKIGEIERKFANKFEILKKANDDYKAIKELSLHEATKLHDHVKSLNQKKVMVEKEIKNLKDIISKQAKEISSMLDELLSLKNSSLKTESKLKVTDSLLQKYKANNTSSILQEDERQLAALRSIAKCSLCSKNWKDTAITVCGHVFCQSCTQERLAARLRRCPSCNKGFSATDLLSVHL